jgi:GNAT superfamily N-acetyltransferase
VSVVANPAGFPSEFKVEALASRHDRAGFACGVGPLDDYLHRRASQDARRRIAAPFVLTAGDDPRVLGYYTLSAVGIVLDELPRQLIKKLPRYPVVPATRLGRLAVDSNHHGRGLGSYLLMNALHRSLRHSRGIASFAVVVDAIDREAERFYRGYEFQKFPTQAGRLFLTMNKIAQLF